MVAPTGRPGDRKEKDSGSYAGILAFNRGGHAGVPDVQAMHGRLSLWRVAA
jgi:hypothetical protein